MTLLQAAEDLLKATLGMFTVLGIWIAVQSYVRKAAGCKPDHDVLDFMAHGCIGCINGQTCKNRMKTAGLNPGMEHNQHEPE